jgi:hypothetical protein
MNDKEAGPRPKGVTILAIFYALASPVVFFFCVLVLVLLFGVGAESNGPLSFWGMSIVYSIQASIIVFPVALAIVAVGLWLGKKWARAWTVAISIANLVCVFVMYSYLFRGSINELYSIMFPLDVLVQFAIIYYMFTPKAKDFLRQ